MKYLLFFIIFFNTQLYSQKKIKADSIRYYSNLIEINIKDNQYKEVLFYTQKAIDFCKNNNKIGAEAILTYNLGQIYFDLKLYNDAIETFNKSIYLFNTISKKGNVKTADAYYFIGLSYIEKKNMI